jgi:hypothetical protein
MKRAAGVCTFIFPFVAMLALCLSAQYLFSFISEDIYGNESSVTDNENFTTMNDLINPTKALEKTNHWRDTDFNVTILDKKYHHSAVLSDDYEVIFKINENGDIRTTDDMKTYYSVEIGKTYPASFYTEYETKSNRICYIGFLNGIKA